MYDTTIATKLLKQLEVFLGRISPHFHKPTARFIGDMIYGIMVEKDIKLASIVRALKEKITPKKVEDRLSRMLSSAGLETGLHDIFAFLFRNASTLLLMDFHLRQNENHHSTLYLQERGHF